MFTTQLNEKHLEKRHWKKKKALEKIYLKVLNHQEKKAEEEEKNTVH